MEHASFIANLAELICSKKKANEPIIVGVNGIDGSGKTVLCDQLSTQLERLGFPVCSLSIDNFHNPEKYRYQRGELSPEAYYQDSFNYEAFIQTALKPVHEAYDFPVQCQTKIWDLDSEQKDVHFSMISKETILLTEGVFLFRPEIHRYLHLSIFVDADFDTILERVKSEMWIYLGKHTKLISATKQNTSLPRLNTCVK